MSDFTVWDELYLPKPDSEETSVTKLLLNDIYEVQCLLLENPQNAFARRMLVRCVFTMIEGVIFAIKTHLLAVNKKYLSAEEVAILSESTYELDDSGKIKNRPSFVKLPPNVKFTFALYASSFGADYEVPTGGNGWRAFIESLKVRNRLTHPKSYTDLIVTDKEVAEAEETIKWFIETFKEMTVVSQSMREAITLSVSPDESGETDISTLYEERLKVNRVRMATAIADIIAEPSDPGNA